MECSRCADFQKNIDEQKLQVARYETKLRDLVSAYKSLTTEKQSLEVALSLLSPKDVEEVKDIEEKDDTLAKSEREKQPIDQLEALKQAVTTLTLISKRKEMEFKKDRRSLVEAKDEWAKRCEELEQQLKSQKQQNRAQAMKNLRAQLVETQTAYEKAMTDHGFVLAELQQQYTNEKKHSEILEKQITEMSQRLATKDELIKRAEVKLKQLAQLEKEVAVLRKKAELTPTMRVMREELVNVKSSCDQELIALRTRNAIQKAQLQEKDARIGLLEQRFREASERSAQSERYSIELEGKVAELDKQLNEIVKEDCPISGDKNLSSKEDYGAELTDKKELLCPFGGLKKQQPEIDTIDTISSETSSQHKLSDNNYDENISNAAPFISALQFSSGTSSRIESSTSLNVFEIADRHSVSPLIDEQLICNACLAHRKDIDYYKSFVGHLQHKITTMEENHERKSKEHDNVTEMLRKRIFELEHSHQHTFSQLTAEARQRVTELEEELNKQRARVIEVMAEKDREIEITKNSLAALYAPINSNMAEDNGVNALPMDPRPKALCSDDPSAAVPRRSNSENESNKKHKWSTDPHNYDKITDEPKRIDAVERNDDEDGDRRGSVGEPSLDRARIDFSASYHSTTSHRLSRNSMLVAPIGENMLTGTVTAPRNIFYEQELCKKEQEIIDLRNVIRLLELKARDIEQAMLMKDIQYLQIIETLKEEIRVLESRLTLAGSQTNMAYLRNIFIQFVNQGSVSGRKHILKAIGAVLQLTPVEMRRIDRWSH